MDTIVIYRSPASKSHDDFNKSLLSLITERHPTIVFGDFNVDPKLHDKKKGFKNWFFTGKNKI